MSVWSWIKCYLGLGSEEEDLREEMNKGSGAAGAGSQSSSHTTSTGSRPGGSTSGNNGGSRLGSGSATGNSGSRFGGNSGSTGTGSRFGGNSATNGGSRFGGNSGTGGSRFGRGNGAASGRPVRVHLADGDSIEIIPLGSVVYGGKSYMVVKPPMPLEDYDGDDDRLVLVALNNGTYDVADDGEAIMYALDNVEG